MKSESSKKRKSTLVGETRRGLLLDSYIPDPNKKSHGMYIGKCVNCGKEHRVKRYLLYNKDSGFICECSSKRNHHGMSYTRIYSIYAAIKERTILNTGNEAFIRDYINRGIGLCEEWQGKNGFNNFYEWAMSHGYQDNLSIDRIDNDGDYSPDNCRWADAHTQNCNRRNTIKATINNRTMAVCDWCHELNIDYDTVYGRMRKGWSAEKALLTPINDKYVHKKGTFLSDKRVKQFSREHEFIKEWDSVYEASRETGISRSVILNCCLGKTLCSRKYIWEFAEQQFGELYL